MPIIRCKEGFHLYDDSKHDSCPYCRNAGRGHDIPSTRPAPKAGGGGNKQPSSDSSSAAPKTRPAYRPSPGSEPAMTKGVWQVKREAGGQPVVVDPVVGWVVCTKGPNFGRDYRLRAGLNQVGRGTSMDVCISGDEKIARESQASIAFDPESGSFFLQHGGGRNLTYVNGLPALSMVILSHGDRIRFGDTEMIFIPLCTEQFQWDGLESK